MRSLEGKTILVTGAGGSIGSELCRQILKDDPAKLVMFDSSELALYNIDRELGRPVTVIPVLGDVSDETDVALTFGDHDFDVVYHAAAYKHVTLCEKNWGPAHRVNVYGTRLLVDTAARHGVPRFILISTDKAVNPTCVMGVTKKLAENIVRKANYTTVRLGNVWGSSGSVVPLWKEQIAAGKPVTMTDPGALRYFIQPQGAALWIIRASEIAEGGDTFVPDMGVPVRMFDVAQELGATKFDFIGLRPGEKRMEELFAGKPENCGWGTKLWKDAA